VLKLSRGLVLTGWQALSICNLILNCAGSSRSFLRQKFQDGKHVPSSKFVKRLVRNIHRNRWCITQGTQLERKLLRLKSCCYSKSCPDPMLITSPWCDDQKSFLVCFNSLADLVLVYRSLPTKYTPWCTFTIESYRCGFTNAFLQPFCLNSAFVSTKSI
jgi:hypothetical protein